jgi:hypothetical protein
MITFDAEGNVLTSPSHGVIERLRFADGSLFISAGRYVPTNFEPGFTIVPTVGRSGDVAALCAALAA